MALRKYTNPRNLDLSAGLQDVIRRNGMQAHISMLPNGQMQLIVLGHDSPAITYNLNDRQVEDLMGWGSNYVNKKAYNTFTSIVKNDFYLPDNFVSARNAFGRVAMGLHGYRMGAGEYGLPYYRPFSRSSRGWGGDFIGWEAGWNMRRIGGRTFMAGGGIMTPVRPDGRVKPGELNAGGYGFYYKGQQQQTRQDVLDNVIADNRILPVKAEPRPERQAIPYSERIWEGETNSFTNEKFQEVLKSHGIIIDVEKKTLTIQSSHVPIDLRYDLTEEELQTITAEGLNYPNGKTVAERLAVINERIMEKTPDFANPITVEMLEAKNLVNLELTEEAKNNSEIAAFYEQQQRYAEKQGMLAESQQARLLQQQRSKLIAEDPQAIDGLAIKDILGNKGWFQPVNNGREMVVGRIAVQDYQMNNVVEWDNTFNLERFNEILGDDFNIDPNSKMLTIKYYSEVKGETKEFTVPIKDKEMQVFAAESLEEATFEQRLDALREVFTSGAYPGRREQAKKAWDEIWRNKLLLREEQAENLFIENDKENYPMTAVINGEIVSHTISKKDYDKFMALDDAHRLKLFDKIFTEVKIKDTSDNSQYDDIYLGRDGQVMVHDGLNTDYAVANYVDGATLQNFKQHKGFYREINHGREVEVGEIRVDKEADGKYKMTAVIDGQSITHEITQKQYDKFLAVDDYQRMKLFSKIFDEVDIKTRPGEGTNFGAALLAALVSTGEVLADPMWNHRGPGPEIYRNQMPGNVYYKPGVVSPSEVAAANFESLDRPERSYGESRGMGM